MKSPITLDGIIVSFSRVEFHLARPRIIQVKILTRKQWPIFSTLAVGQPGDSRASGCPSSTYRSPPQNRKSSALKEAFNQGFPVKTTEKHEKTNLFISTPYVKKSNQKDILSNFLLFQDSKIV